MFRDPAVYLEDMLEAIAQVQEYTKGYDKKAFRADRRTRDAVTKNLEVLGEAAKGIPDELRNQHPDVEWGAIAGLRDILVHRYFAVNIHIVWDIVQTKLVPLAEKLRRILASLEERE